MSINKTVREVGRTQLMGNVVPHSWYKHIKFASGKPNLNAVVILADIWGWYQPFVVLEEGTNKVVKMDKKFKGDKLETSYKNLENFFGLTEKQCRDAIALLKEMKLITVELRDLEGRNNVMFVEPCVSNIIALEDIDTPSALQDTPSALQVTTLCPTGNQGTKNGQNFKETQSDVSLKEKQQKEEEKETKEKGVYTHTQKEKKETEEEREQKEKSPAREVFDYWQTTANKLNCKPTSGRMAKILARLSTYTVEELKRAIDGCQANPFYLGENDRKTAYNYPEVIFKNDESAERHIAYLDNGLSLRPKGTQGLAKGVVMDSKDRENIKGKRL